MSLGVMLCRSKLNAAGILLAASMLRMSRCYFHVEEENLQDYKRRRKTARGKKPYMESSLGKLQMWVERIPGDGSSMVF